MPLHPRHGAMLLHCAAAEVAGIAGVPRRAAVVGGGLPLYGALLAAVLSVDDVFMRVDSVLQGCGDRGGRATVEGGSDQDAAQNLRRPGHGAPRCTPKVARGASERLGADGHGDYLEAAR